MRDPIKVYDARWEVSEFNDLEVVRLFEASLAYGEEQNVNHIVLTRDARLGCARVLELAVKTAMRMGFKISLLTDPVSTPMSYFVALKTSVDYPGTMGLTITASHNPSNYIGVKFTIPTVHAIGYDCGPMGGLKRIGEIYHSDQEINFKSGGSLKIINHPAKEYINYSFKTAGLKPGDLKGLNVVLDAFHGSAGPEVYQALTNAGVKVTALRLIPNGEFPTGSPNPTSQNKMDEAVTLAAKINADVVIGLDGDGDRIVFGDSRGILNAGFATIPILRALLKAYTLNDTPAVLYDSKVNPIALAEWGKLNVKPVLFRNGHSQIKDFMVQSKALAAAEESGHYYHRLTYKDLVIAAENSILTILLFLKELKHNPGLMDGLWEKQKQVFTTGEFNYQFTNDENRDKALNATIDFFKRDGAATATQSDSGEDLQGTVIYKGVDIFDGKVLLAEGWYSGYLRIATNEKGVVRSYLSLADPTSGKELEKKVREILSVEYKGVEIE